MHFAIYPFLFLKPAGLSVNNRPQRLKKKSLCAVSPFTSHLCPYSIYTPCLTCAS